MEYYYKYGNANPIKYNIIAFNFKIILALVEPLEYYLHLLSAMSGSSSPDGAPWKTLFAFAVACFFILECASAHPPPLLCQRCVLFADVHVQLL